MAKPGGQLRVGRYFLALIAVIAVLYALVYFTGSEHTPRLGLDLRGGTTVTLEALTADGQPPSEADLETARQIIERRVNGLGVASAEVVTEGDSNIVISVPGDRGEQAKQLGATARLEIRPVMQGPVPAAGTGMGADPNAPPPADPNAPPPADPNAPPPADPNASPPAGQPPAFTGADPADALLAEDAPWTDLEAAPGDPTTPPATPPATPPPGTPPPDPSQQPPVTMEQASMQLAALDCSKDPVQATNPRPDDYIAACSTDGQNKFVLGPVLIPGTEVDSAEAGFDNQGGQGWLVTLDFESQGGDTWAQFTSQAVGQSVGFVLDNRVVSAPRINEPIPGGTTQITGDFNEESAKELASSLNYGALPLNFTQSEARTVSATLGSEQLKAGLIAGGIGLALVVLYCLVYYRLLGFVTIISLILSAVVVYAVLVLLGRQIGFTLTLAGIAGFIVSIGITADSFVIFFERLKDEVRDGRSMRSAVPRAWTRSRRTILSADAVSFLAAAVLYALAVGEVRGFAFTLGLSTVLDLIVVFLFTHPLVAWLSRFKAFSSARISGLGRSARPTRRASPPPPPGRRPQTREA